jgi:hypothetical protein
MSGIPGQNKFAYHGALGTGAASVPSVSFVIPFKDEALSPKTERVFGGLKWS